MKCRLGYVDCLLLGPGRFLGIRRKESSSQAGGGDGEQTHSLPLLLTESHCFPVARYLSEEEVLDTENPFVQLLSSWLRIHLQCRRPRFDPRVRTISWRRKWQFNPVCLPGKSHGQRGLVDYSPWGHKGQTRLSNYTTTSHLQV